MQYFTSLISFAHIPLNTNFSTNESSNIQKKYIDPEWVAKEYLRRCKAGAWKAGNDMDSLKCWNLERIIDAEMYGNTKPGMLTMEELLTEGMDVVI